MLKPMDYSFLRGKIVENCKSASAFARKLGISRQSLSYKLNNKTSFTQEQISMSIEILSLTEEETMKCFFLPLKVEKTSTSLR